MNEHLIFENLSQNQAIAYAFINAQRLSVEYQHFQKIRNWGNSERLGYLMEKGLEGFDSDDEIEKAIIDVETISPDGNDFQGVDFIYALDACCAVYDYLYYIKTQELSYLESIYNLCLNSTDIYVRDLHNPDDFSDRYNNDYTLFEEKEKSLHSDIIKCISSQNALSSRQIVENVYRVIPKAQLGIIGFLSS